MSGFTNTEKLSVYTHLRTFESDFDKSQSQVRAICSAWSAAVVGAVGLIAINSFAPPAGITDLAVRGAHLAYLRALICMIGTAGVFAFWFIDQRVYQKMLHSIFAYGLFLEFKNPDLPQVRSSLFISHLDVTSGLSLFYRLQLWIFVLIAAIFVWPPFSIDLGPIPPGIKSLTEVHVILTVVAELYSRRWYSLRKIIEELYPDLWTVLPARRQTIPTPFGHPPPDNEDRRKKWKARITSPQPMPPA